MIRSFKVAWSAWRQQKQEKRVKLTRLEREFQPAAIELIETPASPTLRLVSALMIAFICGTLTWSYIGQIDVHANLQGKIVPTGRSQVVNAPLGGQIQHLNVSNGDRVSKDEILFVIDPAAHEVELQRAQAELQAAEAAMARQSELIQLVSEYREGSSELRCASVEKKDSGYVCAAIGHNLVGAASASGRDVATFFEAYIAERTLVVSQLREKELEAVGSKQTLGELGKTLKLVDEQVGMQTKLLKTKTTTRSAYLGIKRESQEALTRVAQEEVRLQQINAEMATLRTRLDEMRNTKLSKLLEERLSYERQVKVLRGDVEKAKLAIRLSSVRAPVDGTVQELSISTLGHTLASGQKMMVIVPTNQPLEVEAMVLNRDIGNVVVGQTARLKVEAFPFTKYGTIEGEIVSVARDAVTAGRPAHSDQSESIDGLVGNLVFPVKIRMKSQSIKVNGEMFPLSPGMSVVAEVKTDERRVLSYFLNPVLEALDESIRER